MSTAKLIKDGRKRLQMTEKEFADAVGVSRAAVQQWERGTTTPKRDRQQAIARRLGISVVELMGLDAANPGTTEMHRNQGTAVFASEPPASYSATDPAEEAASLVRRMSPAGQVEALEFLRFMATRHGGSPAR